MPVTQEDFRAALSRFTSGITVVTSRDRAGDLHGITVSAFCSVSLQPPLILVCIEKTTGSHEAVSETGSFIVNILGTGQEQLSERFALPVPDKFQGVAMEAGVSGIPFLNDALVVLECRLVRSYDGGDHSIFVGEVENAAARDGGPLVYFHGSYRALAEV